MTITQPRYPLLLEINTRVLLSTLGRRLGRKACLADIPEDMLDAWAADGFDWIWMLSIWTTGPAGRAISLAHEEWRAEFQDTLDDLAEEDIQGSGFAITRYAVDARIGDPDTLVQFRRRLQQRGMRLMLDFVPNHTGPDHCWVTDHPEYYIQGTEALLEAFPSRYFRSSGGHILAFGRDPYFEGWPDTVQLDYSLPALCKRMLEELLHIAAQCDGVRCDMAMLILPEVFERTWGRRALPFWSTAIKSVLAMYPDFCFLAEVYWDMAWTLQQQGFAYSYDKHLYDELRKGKARPVREHLSAGMDVQEKFVRFLENHDELRAATAFPTDKHIAAAVITYLSPGLRFFHQGQREGFVKRISPHLARGPEEPANPYLSKVYRILLDILRDPLLRSGSWRLLHCKGAWPGNDTWDNFIAFDWQNDAGMCLLVTVNFAPYEGQCYVVFPTKAPAGRTWCLTDKLSEQIYDRDGNDMAERGLYLAMGPWQSHVFEVTSI